MFKLNKQISGDIIRSTNACHVGNINVLGINYYVKPDDDKLELIGYKLATLSNISAIPYYYVLVRNKNYAVSRDLKGLGQFLLAEDLLGEETSITLIINKMRKLVFFTEELEKQFYMMYFFDLLFLNTDGYTRNFGFYNDKSRWNLIVFDHINMFDFKFPIAMRFNSNNFTYSSKMENYYKDFQELFYSLPLTIQDIILKMYDLYSIDKVEEILKEINPDKATLFLSIYEPHYKKIGDILNRGVIYAR